MFKNKFFTQSILFFIISALGLLLRIFFITRNEVFVDEVYYLITSRSESFFSLITISGFLKDHAILYMVFLKLFLFLTTNIILLRLSGLIIYLITNFVLFNFLKKFKSKTLALIGCFLFSVLPYFVILNSYLSPYNFVLLFSAVAFISILNFIFLPVSKHRFKYALIFIISSSLAFYSDYSVIYFYLPFIPIFFLILKWNEKNAKDLSKVGFINFLLILPGIIQIFKNFKVFYSLNYYDYNPIISFSTFLHNFSNIIFFPNGDFSSILLIYLLLFLLFYSYHEKERLKKFLALFSVSVFSIDVFFFYFFNRTFFYIFKEKTFWMFYFALLMGIILVFDYLRQVNNRKLLLFSVSLLLVFIFAKYIQAYSSDPIAEIHMNYASLFEKLITDKNFVGRGNIIFFDKNSTSVVFSKYYFKGLSLINDTNDGSHLRRFIENKKITTISATRSLNKKNLLNGMNIFIIVDFDAKSIVANLIYELGKEKKRSDNNYFYGIKCNNNVYCGFYKIQ